MTVNKVILVGNLGKDTDNSDDFTSLLDNDVSQENDNQNQQ